MLIPSFFIGEEGLSPHFSAVKHRGFTVEWHSTELKWHFSEVKCHFTIVKCHSTDEACFTLIFLYIKVKYIKSIPTSC